MAESSNSPKMEQSCEEKEPITQKIDEDINPAKKPRKSPHSSQTFKIVDYKMEAKGLPLNRPSLARPSKNTVDLVHAIFKDFFIIRPKWQINVDFIRNNISLCPQGEDILLVEDKNHYNLLHKAIIFGSIDVLEILIDHGCDVNGIKSEEVCGRGLEQCPYDHVGAFHLACFLGRLDVVRYLLAKGADPSLEMKIGPSEAFACVGLSQPGVPKAAHPSTISEILSKCGRREAAFYAVLQNNVPMIKLLLERYINPEDGDTANNRYLQHLACKVGVYESFEYLVGMYSWDINEHTDGGGLFMTSILSDLRFARLLLEHNCDHRKFDKFYWPNFNILNMIFVCDDIHSLKNAEGLSDILRILLERGVDMNSQRYPTKATPLHDLLETFNFANAWNAENLTEEDGYHLFLRKLDKEVMDSIMILVDNGADLFLKDNYSRTPLQMLLLNSNHVLRYGITKNESVSDNVIQVLQAECYGLENTIKLIKILVNKGAIKKDIPIVESFVNLLCFDPKLYGPMPGRAHRIEILKEDSLFDNYKETLRFILNAGADLNVHSVFKRNSPLFSLLLHVGKLPYTPGDIIDFEFAERMSAFLSILLSHGALTEAHFSPFRNCIDGIQWRYDDMKMFSCFDMLIHSLVNLRDNPLPAKSLQILHLLVTILLQHGASARVFQNTLYNVREYTEQIARENELHPRHTFFFQYLMFGMFNLAYVNDGPWYQKLFNVLYSQIDHHNLYKVLGLVTKEFYQAHSTIDCACGQCSVFRELLESVADTPRTLKKLARLVIYNSLKDNLETKVNVLPLPNTLKMCIMTFGD